MTSSGSFTANPTWITTFLTSPGTPGSNFSYTSPVVPAGAYTVRIRGTDQHDLVTTDPPARSVTVTHPPNNKPVAVQLGTGVHQEHLPVRRPRSTDENAPTLTYSWNFGTGAGTGTGRTPRRPTPLRAPTR